MIARFYDYPLEEEKEGALVPQSYDFKVQDLTFVPNYKFDFEFKQGTKNLILLKSFSSLDHFYDALMGFSDHTSGNVYFDGKLLQDLDIGEIRNHVQIIAHDQFFAGTILENLSGLGKDLSFTLTEIHEVLKRVGLFDNIMSLPNQLQTEIKPNGFPLTKSQLLAIQIGRAILLQPKILLVTPDYEQISSYKRKIIYSELIGTHNPWTLLFFTQRFYKANFDRYTVFERSEMRELSGEAELLKEIEVYG